MGFFSVDMKSILFIYTGQKAIFESVMMDIINKEEFDIFLTTGYDNT